MKRIVVPGEYIKEDARLPFAYIEKDKAYSKVIGLYDEEKDTIIPLEGGYVPHVGDEIIGVIISERNGVYEVDIQQFNKCILITGKRDEYIEEGTVISAKVKSIENRRTIIVEMPRKLIGGMLIYIKPTKIPRVIGRNNTMIKMLTELTKTHIAVGMNGLVWLKGGNIALAIEALLRIENEAHIGGLTNRIKLMLENAEKEPR